MKLTKVNKENFDFLVDIGIIVFDNEGLKKAYERLNYTLNNNLVDHVILENNLDENKIKFFEFSDMDYVHLSDDEKDIYENYWFERLVFFSKVDYQWDKNSFEPYEYLKLEGIKVTIKSNIEVLGKLKDNGIFLTQDFIKQTPIAVDINNTVEEDTLNLEQYSIPEYKVPDNISLVSNERDRDYYINNIYEAKNLEHLISLIEDLNKMNDEMFKEILVMINNKSINVDLSLNENEINENFFKYGDVDVWIQTTTSIDRNNGMMYFSIFDFKIPYGYDLKPESIKILNNFYVRIAELYLDNFNNSPSIREIEEHQIVKLLKDMLLHTNFIPNLEFNIDENIQKLFLKTENNKISHIYNDNILINKNKEYIEVVTKNVEYTDLKNKIKVTLSFLSEKWIFNAINELKDDFTYNSMSVSNTGVVFALVKLFDQYNTNKRSDEYILLREKLLMKIINHRNENNNMVSIFNNFIVGEKLTNFIQLNTHEQIMYASLDDRSNMCTKLLSDIKNNLRVNELTLYIKDFYEEKITDSTSKKAMSILQLLKDPNNFSAQNFEKLFGISKSSALIKEREFYSKVSSDVSFIEFINFNTLEELKELDDFILYVNDKFPSYVLSTITEVSLLSKFNCLIKNQVDFKIIEDYINKNKNDLERKRNDKKMINGIVEYFSKNKQLKTKKLDDILDNKLKTKQKHDILRDIVTMSDNILFELVSFTFKERVTSLVISLYEDKEMSLDNKINLDLMMDLAKNNLFNKELLKFLLKNEKESTLLKIVLKNIVSNFYHYDSIIRTSMNAEDIPYDFMENLLKKRLEMDFTRMDNTTINEMLYLSKNKEDIFLAIIKNLNLSQYMDFDMQKININKNKSIDKNNKRLFKKIMNQINILVKELYLSNENENVLKVVNDNQFKLIYSVANCFNESFRNDEIFLSTICDLSKIVQQEIESNGWNEKTKREITNIYMLLPKNLSKLAVDNCQQGKLFHKVFDNIKMLEEINTIKPVIEKTKKKL